MSPITLSAFAILGVQSRMTSRHSWAMVWGGMLQAESPASHTRGAEPRPPEQAHMHCYGHQLGKQIREQP